MGLSSGRSGGGAAGRLEPWKFLPAFPGLGPHPGPGCGLDPCHDVGAVGTGTGPLGPNCSCPLLWMDAPGPAVVYLLASESEVPQSLLSNIHRPLSICSFFCILSSPVC